MNQSVGPKPSQPERSIEAAEPRAVLRSVFGYADFRGPQEAIVRHVIAVSYTHLTLPTKRIV